MRFPKRIGVVLAKIALERITSPERADELVIESRKAVGEISAWWNRQEKSPAEEVTVEEATKQASDEIQSTGSLVQQKEAAGIVRRIEDQIVNMAENEGITEKEIGEIIESEIKGKTNTLVIWLDEAKIVGAKSGRYVHFSYLWDNKKNRFGYRIRDFETNKIYHPPQTDENGVRWIPTELAWTADDVWRAAKRRIRTVRAKGLGEADLGSVDQNRDRWRAVLNALTKNMPVGLVNGLGATS